MEKPPTDEIAEIVAHLERLDEIRARLRERLLVLHGPLFDQDALEAKENRFQQSVSPYRN